MLNNSPNRNLLVVTGSLAITAITMSVCAYILPRFPGDLNLALFFQSLHSNALLSLMKWVSYVTAGWRSVLLVIAGSLIVRWLLGRREAIMMTAAGLCSLLASVFKIIIGRPRPSPDLVQVWVVDNSGSFPSGHAFYAMLFLGLAVYFLFTRMNSTSLKTTTMAILISVILLVGLSRVYLGAHWPSDVLGGYLYGAVFLGILIWFDMVAKKHLKVNAKQFKKHGLT
jgi:undecaprenyl-diphosphatase